MKYRRPFLLLALFWVPLCQGAVVAATGTISSLKNLSLLQPDGRLQGVVVLQLSVPLANGCNWAWISPTDKGTAATALAAKLSGGSVTVWYDSTIVSPWGEADICGITEIDLN